MPRPSQRGTVVQGCLARPKAYPQFVSASPATMPCMSSRSRGPGGMVRLVYVLNSGSEAFVGQCRFPDLNGAVDTTAGGGS